MVSRISNPANIFKTAFNLIIPDGNSISLQVFLDSILYIDYFYNPIINIKIVVRPIE
jgi:hypothetical protein